MTSQNANSSTGEQLLEDSTDTTACPSEPSTHIPGKPSSNKPTTTSNLSFNGYPLLSATTPQTTRSLSRPNAPQMLSLDGGAGPLAPGVTLAQRSMLFRVQTQAQADSTRARRLGEMGLYEHAYGDEESESDASLQIITASDAPTPLYSSSTSSSAVTPPTHAHGQPRPHPGQLQCDAVHQSHTRPIPPTKVPSHQHSQQMSNKTKTDNDTVEPPLASGISAWSQDSNQADGSSRRPDHCTTNSTHTENQTGSGQRRPPPPPGPVIPSDVDLCALSPEIPSSDPSTDAGVALDAGGEIVAQQPPPTTGGSIAARLLAFSTSWGSTASTSTITTSSLSDSGGRGTSAEAVPAPAPPVDLSLLVAAGLSIPDSTTATPNPNLPRRSTSKRIPRSKSRSQTRSTVPPSSPKEAGPSSNARTTRTTSSRTPRPSRSRARATISRSRPETSIRHRSISTPPTPTTSALLSPIYSDSDDADEDESGNERDNSRRYAIAFSPNAALFWEMGAKIKSPPPPVVRARRAKGMPRKGMGMGIGEGREGVWLGTGRASQVVVPSDDSEQVLRGRSVKRTPPKVENDDEQLLLKPGDKPKPKSTATSDGLPPAPAIPPAPPRGSLVASKLKQRHTVAAHGRSLSLSSASSTGPSAAPPSSFPASLAQSLLQDSSNTPTSAATGGSASSLVAFGLEQIPTTWRAALSRISRHPTALHSGSVATGTTPEPPDTAPLANNKHPSDAGGTADMGPHLTCSLEEVIAAESVVSPTTRAELPSGLRRTRSQIVVSPTFAAGFQYNEPLPSFQALLSPLPTPSANPSDTPHLNRRRTAMPTRRIANSALSKKPSPPSEPSSSMVMSTQVMGSGSTLSDIADTTMAPPVSDKRGRSRTPSLPPGSDLEVHPGSKPNAMASSSSNSRSRPKTTHMSHLLPPTPPLPRSRKTSTTNTFAGPSLTPIHTSIGTSLPPSSMTGTDTDSKPQAPKPKKHRDSIHRRYTSSPALIRHLTSLPKSLLRIGGDDEDYGPALMSPSIPPVPPLPSASLVPRMTIDPTAPPVEQFPPSLNLHLQMMALPGSERGGPQAGLSLGKMNDVSSHGMHRYHHFGEGGGVEGEKEEQARARIVVKSMVGAPVPLSTGSAVR